MNKIEKETLKNNLLEIYNINSNINFTIDNYIFPHEILLKEIKRIEFIINKLLKEKNKELYGNSFYCTHLRIYIDKTNNYLEQLEIHLDVLNEVLNNNQSYKKIITKQKNIIKLNYIKLYFLKNKIEIKLKKHEKTPYKFDLYKEIFIQPEYRKMISKEAKIVFEDKKREYNAEIGLIYTNYLRMDLETFFVKESNIYDYIQRMKTEYIKIKELTVDKLIDNSHIDLLLELINNYTDKYLILMKYTNNKDSSLKDDYIEILKIKYNYLKINPNQMEYTSVKNDLYKEEAYLERMKEDWNKTFGRPSYSYIILSQKFLKNHLDELLENDIYFELFLCTLNTEEENYLEWIKRKVNLKEFLSNKYNFSLKDFKGIELKDYVTIETLIILLCSIYIDVEYLRQILIGLHKKYPVQYNGHTIFDGIKKINFDESNAGDELFSYLSSFEYINISKDVESIKTKKRRSINCSCIIFSEGLKNISLKNVKGKINYYFPSSVENIILNTDNTQHIHFNNFNKSKYRNLKKLSSLLTEYLYDNKGYIKSTHKITTRFIFHYPDNLNYIFDYKSNQLPIEYSFSMEREELTQEEIKNYLENSPYLKEIVGINELNKSYQKK